MSSNARKPRRNAPRGAFFTRNLILAIAIVSLSAVASLAAFGPQALSFQRLMSPFVGAAAPGGQVEVLASQDTEHFAPAATATTVNGTLATARTGHTATLLSDGRVLVVGGSGDTSAEIFDPATSLAVATGNTNAARSGHTATRLADGRVLIAGGSGDATTEIYDAANGTFSPGPNMTASRTGHTATALSNGNILVAGGGNDSAEVFDGTAFAATGSLGTPRTNASAALMADGRVIIVGGDALNSIEIFSNEENTFEGVSTEMRMDRSRAHLHVLSDGKVQIIGGNTEGTMEVYDPVGNVVGAFAHVVPETDPCLNLINHVLAAQTRSALIFPGSSATERNRSGFTVTELGSSAVVIGGTDSSGSALSTTEVYGSSSATITTDKIDYLPGETVNVAGTGYQPGETVRVMIHEDPHTEFERGFDSVADASGNFTGTYLVQDYDLNVNFIAGARGLSSGFTAQTTFRDAISPYQQGGQLTGNSAFSGTCTNPGNARLSDNTRATCTNNQTIIGSEFGFGNKVPIGATGITFSVRTEGFVTNTLGDDDLAVELSWDGGATYTTSGNNTGELVGSDSVLNVPNSGNSSFGRTWSASDLSDSNFRVRVIARTSAGGDVIHVDEIAVRVTWNGSLIEQASVVGATTAVATVSSTLRAALTVNHTADTSAAEDWQSTSYQFEGQVASCDNTPNFTSSNTDTQGFTMSGIPSVPGVYDVTFMSFSGANCTGVASAPFTLTNAVEVGIFGDSVGIAQTNNYTGTNGWVDSDSGSGCSIETRAGIIDSNGYMQGANGCTFTRSNISTAGRTNVQIKYKWGQTTDGDGGDDGDLVVEWKPSASGTWLPVNSHDLGANNPNTDAVTSITSTLTGGTAANSTIDIRFRFATSEANDEGRIDDVIVSGPQITTVNSVTASASTFGGTTNLSATVSPANVAGSVDFFINGSPTPISATYVQATGVATVSGHLHGLNASVTPYSVRAVFAPTNPDFVTSEAINNTALLVNKADQIITPAPAAPATAIFADSFSVAATGGASGQPVVIAGSGSCSGGGNGTATITMTSGAGTCTVTYNQAGNSNYNAAPQVSNTTTAQPAATNLVVSTATGTYGGTVNLTATLTRTSIPNGVLNGKSVTFTLNGNSVGSALTDINGVASLNGVFLTNNGLVAGTRINANTYPTGIGASFATETNYTGSIDTDSLTVNQKSVTATVTADNKVYDGNTLATINSCTPATLESGDTVTCSAAGPNTFDNKNAGSGKTVTATDISLGGTHAANYVLSSMTATAAANILTKAITAALTAANKEYDGGNTEPNANMSCAFTGLIPPDAVTCTPSAGTFNTKDVATANLVTATVTIGGDDGGNYTLGANGTAVTATSATDAATITPKTLTASIIGNPTKPYDGNTSAALTPANFSISGLVGTESFSVSQTAGTYNNANVASASSVTATLAPAHFAPSGGADAANYVLPVSATGAGSIVRAATVTVVTFENGAYVYRGTPFTATAQVTGPGLIEPLPVLYTGDCTNVTGANGCTASAIYLESDNYLESEDSRSITIAPATATIVVNDYSVQYDGLPHGLTGTATGVNSTDLAGFLSFGLAVTNVPGGSISWNFNAGANYNTASGSATVTITQAPSSTVVTCPVSAVYTSEPQSPCNYSVTGIGGLNLSGTANHTDNVNVGTATASYTYAGDLNHTGSIGSATFQITAIALTIDNVVAQNKVYDGLNTATVTYGALVGVISGDTVTIDLTNGYSATFNNENVGDDKPVTVVNVKLAGAEAGNYTVSQPTGLTADITKKQLTLVGAAAQNKIYDGTTDAFVTFPASPTGLTTPVLNDDVGFNASLYVAQFANKNVANGIGISVTGVVLTGADAPNYDLAQPTGLSANITPKALTASFTVADRVYDGSAVAIVATPLLTGVVSPDAVTLNITNAFFNDKNVGVGKLVTADTAISGADAGNYTVNATATTNATITPLHITGNFTADNKVYDSTTAATVLNRTLNGFIGGDNVTLTGGTATFDNKIVGNGKTVTLAGAALSGDDAPNYVLDSVATTTANITPATVTGSFTADNKIYNGNTSAAIATRSVAGTIGMDNLTLTGGTATFDTKNVGTGKMVTGVGFTLGGLDAGNYVLASTTLMTTADVTALAITVNAVTDTKTYDGNTSSDGVPTFNALVGDDTGSAIQVFDSRNAGSRTLSVDSYSIDDDNGGANYSVITNTAAGTINQLAITVTAVADSRVYDGTTNSSASPSIAPPLVGGDTSGFTQSFDNRNAGTNKTLTASGSAIDGNGGLNYSVTFVAVNTGVITPRAIAVSAVTDTKTYDATTSSDEIPTVTLGSIVSPDSGSFTQVYDNANAGTGKTLIPSGSVNDANGALNYAITFVNDVTGAISKANASCSVTGYSVTYNGASHIATGSCMGVLGENLTGLDLSGTAHTNAGSYPNDPWTFTDVTGNYNNTNGTVANNIAKANAVIAVTPYSVVYDGNPHTATGTATGVLNEPLAGLDLSGTTHTDAASYPADPWVFTDVTGNYNNANATVADNISQAPVTATAGGGTATYDGLTRTPSPCIISGLGHLGDLTCLNDPATVGPDAAVYSIDPVVSGTGLSNFNITSVQGSYTIDKAGSTTVVTFEPGPYVYRGWAFTATAQVTGNSGPLNHGVDVVISGDCLNVTVANGCTATATYAESTNYIGSSDSESITILKASVTATAGSGSTVYDANTHSPTACTVVGFPYAGTLSCTNSPAVVGPDADTYPINAITGGDNLNNFDVTSVPGSYVISKADANVVVNGYSGTYDGQPHGATGSATGVGGADLSGGLNFGAMFTDVPGGMANWTFAGGTNYQDESDSVLISITPKALTATVDAAARDYNDTNVATITSCTFSGVETGDVVNCLPASYSALFADQHVGINKAVTVTALGISGADAGNYSFNGNGTGSATISALAITVKAVADTKIYDGGAASTVTPTFNALIVGDDTGTATQVFDQKHAGARTLSVSVFSINDGNGGNNYAVSEVDASGTITPLTINVNAVADTKVYDGDTSSNDEPLFVALVGGDTGDATQVFDSRNVGPRTLSVVAGSVAITDGNTGGNYTVTLNPAAGSITPKALTASIVANDKVYDSTTTATFTCSLLGIVTPDIVTCTGTTANFASANVGSWIVTATGLGLGGAGAANYTVNPTATGTADITPAGLIIKAQDKTKIFLTTYTFDMTTSSPDFTVTGLLGSDAVTSITLASTGATALAPAGTHSIIPSAAVGTALTNYTIQYVNGTMSITGYAFDGFRSPIDNSTIATKVWNTVNAGQTVPAKWRLTLNNIPVSALTSFSGLYSYTVSCATGASDLEDPIEEIGGTNSGLTYQGDGNFHYNWKTPKTYAKQCRVMFVQFNDGSQSPLTYFKFK